MIRFAICDDEQVFIDIISEALEKSMDNYPQIPYEVLTFRTTEALMEDPSRYDILFLDIRFNNGTEDGINIGKRLRQQDYDTIIILSSSYTDYLVAGYGTKAIHYLIKPFPQQEIDNAVSKAIDELFHSKSRFIIRYQHSYVFVLVKRIVAIETFRWQRHIHTLDATYVTNEKMEEILSRLSAYQFFRVNRSLPSTSTLWTASKETWLRCATA